MAARLRQMIRLPDIVGWWEGLDRPLRRLPAIAAAALLALTVVACVWSVSAEETYGKQAQASNKKKLKSGARRDFDLYETIYRRVGNGESYYVVALDEQRHSRYPTKPFVTVRPPTLAWSSTILGLAGLRVIAALLWATTAMGLYFGLRGKVRSAEQIGIGLFSLAMGAVALIPKVGLSPEIMAGLFVSAALATYRRERWWPSLLLACCGLAIRELALAYFLLWGALAVSQARWREAAAVGAAVAVFAIGMYFHAQAVIAHQLPTDIVSDGWTAHQGLNLALHGIVLVSLLSALPGWLGPPLAVLPLLGWAALGGRLGLVATCWFAGILTAVALFARIDNFYWVALIFPIYGAGLALVPRALGDLVAALRSFRGRRPDAAASGSTGH
ncbi:hypothetical protein GRI89_05895 [Altererythrobacter salegens]|uniref:Uncharacterized protein n=1 Tax=Croceibacterium salegens TaxID=1737568 RepID=A0A6I4SVI0_9SPHN|nr:hypothetical protein [Croceibacterium salegens]MXO59070.1 hypothetical protein [Croceibacterium salegens]